MVFVPEVVGGQRVGIDYLNPPLACYARTLPPMINWHDPIFVWTAIGTLASLVGLGLGLSAYVIHVTKGARDAARAAERAVQVSVRTS